MRATHSLAAGQVPAAGDLVVAECGDSKPNSVVRYDADLRAVRFTRPVQADEIIAAIPRDLMTVIIPGQKIYVSVRVGPVVVQREVEALQPANPGQSLFVRTVDGQVMSATYAGDGR